MTSTVPGFRWQAAGHRLQRGTGGRGGAARNPLTRAEIRTVDEARAAVKEHVRPRCGLDQAVSDRRVYVQRRQGEPQYVFDLSAAGPAGAG